MWASRFSFFTLWVLCIFFVVIFVVLLKRICSEIYLIELSWELYEKKSLKQPTSQTDWKNSYGANTQWDDWQQKQRQRKFLRYWQGVVAKSKIRIMCSLWSVAQKKRPHMRVCLWRDDLWRTRGEVGTRPLCREVVPGADGQAFRSGFSCTFHFKPRDHSTHPKVCIWGAFAILLPGICQFGLNKLL